MPLSKRTYEWYHVGGFWISEAFSAAQMQVPSSAFALGLNPGLAVVACLVGNILVMVPCAANGYMGPRYGCNFPVLVRSAFGLYGAYLAVFIRAAVTVIYYGIQASLGGNAVQACIEAIWPQFATWHVGGFPASAAITPQGLLGFFIFWLISLPFLCVLIPKLRWLFLVKCCTMPFFWTAMFTWSINTMGGWPPIWSAPSNIVPGFTQSYAFCIAITGAIGANAGSPPRFAPRTNSQASP